MTAPTEKIYENSVGAMVLYAKSTVDDSLVAVKVNPATGALQVDTELTASIDPTGLATHEGQDEIKTAVQSVTSKIIAAPSTEAKQDALIAKFPDQSGGKVPVVQASTPDTSAGDLAKITAIEAKLAALVDGQAPVVAGYKTKRVNVIFTGMDATAQYDAVGALVEIPNWATANGRSATIREIRMSCNNNAIAPQFEIHFYRAADVTVAADNATWTEIAAEYDKRAGYIIMPAMAKPAGSGTIDIVRCQNDDYGQGMSKEVTCAAGSTSIWAKLKLITSGISFASTPGNTIVAAMVIEQS